MVMVHCRMSTLGCVVGGAETVVRALLDVVGPLRLVLDVRSMQPKRSFTNIVVRAPCCPFTPT